MRNAYVLGLVLALAGHTALGAQDSPPEETRFNRIHLKNGNFIDGTVVKDTPTEITLRMKPGNLSIKRDLIEYVELVRIRTRREEPAEPTKGPAATAKGGKSATPREGSSENEKTADPNTEPPSAAPKGISPEIRRRIDALITRWRGTPKKEDSTVTLDFTLEFLDLGRDGVPYLSWLLNEEKGPIPVEAICKALGRLGDSRAVLPLGRLLASGKTDDRSSATQALGAIETPDSDFFLLEALHDEVTEVWRSASDSLLDRFRKNNDDKMVDTLLSRMRKAKAKVPYTYTLGKMGTREAHQGLCDLLENGDEPEQLAALQGLTMIADRKDAILVQRYLRQPAPAVQKEACLLVGKLRDWSSVPDLIDLLKAEDTGLQSNAHWALRQITGQQTPADASLWSRWWDTTGSKERK